jgi:hypothetical protein
MTVKNHHLYQDVQDLEDDLDKEPPSKWVKGKGRAVPTASSSQLLPGTSQATLMVID